MKHLLSGSLLLIAAVCIGCGPSGPELGEVTGKVTLDGEPVHRATIIFQPVAEGGSPSIAETQEDGSYELYYTDRPGALIGEHEVMITTGRQISTEEGGGEVPEMLPPKYNEQTELRKTVEEGGNVINFDLSSN